MWLEKFFKKQFIAFYKEDEYKTILQVVKNKQILSTEEKSFEDKKEFVKYIREKIDDNPQTYISTVLLTINQGVIPSCSKQVYLDKDIDPDNVKILCLGKYSFYVSFYELRNLENEYKFDLDFVYSVFAVIDAMADERKNRFYLLVLKNHLVILGYENFIPIYSDIIELNEEEPGDIDEDIVEDIDLEEELISDIDSVEEEEIDDSEITNEQTSKEAEILNHLKSAIKEYYDNYSSDFIEKIIILDTIGIDITLNSLIEDELLISSEIKQIDFLNSINRLSIESV
ncbi:hypothetical protein [Caminibacter pacificus]|uniref:Uncharacterized protein n=1 Tax=Caminibacter pacificus TaxID=1424653 RepID=A0AAJ4UY19_9BACT|nr:hypothetical protein [Caminibacter pacificus]QCI27708.1 hypothetical protein C6V80_01630 [Caminibacter pacificus]ROR40116.1 hypothetical protein EDC58_1101 [Caminibacter pacificus]